MIEQYCCNNNSNNENNNDKWASKKQQRAIKPLKISELGSISISHYMNQSTRLILLAQMRNKIAPWFLCNTNIQCQEVPTLVFFEWYGLIMNTGASMVQRPTMFMVLEHPRWSSVFQTGLSHVYWQHGHFFRWETIKKTTYSSWTGTQENTGWKIWCTYQPLLTH